jgi:hypothetical protein
MKKFFAVFILAAGLTACNDNAGTGATTTDTVPAATGADTSGLKVDTTGSHMDSTSHMDSSKTKM